MNLSRTIKGVVLVTHLGVRALAVSLTVLGEMFSAKHIDPFFQLYRLDLLADRTAIAFQPENFLV